jgi:serine/threonine-protein kinase
MGDLVGQTITRGRALPLARRLEELWRHGLRPDIHGFLADAGAAPPAEVAAALAIDQWQRWQAGERIPAEEYLQRYPALAAEPEHAVELVYGEFLVREELGEAPAPAEYLERFPRYAARLEDQFQLHRGLEGRTARLDAAPAPGVTGTVLRPTARPSLPEAPGLSPGPAVDGYELLGELGRGGMAVVYKARQRGLNRLVALKFLRWGPDSSAEERARFHGEAEAVARLKHSNVVQVYEVGEQDGRPFLALELLEGGSLARWLNGTPWPARAAADLVEPLARAVHVAHKLNIIHRDLKPDNILLTADGTPKVADFGLAKLLDGDGHQTGTGSVLGTPSYMAPEQAQGRRRDIGPATDVYALGAVLYQLLTGRPPFRAETPMDTVMQVITEEPVPPARLNPKLPRDLESICLKCLQKEPHRRYASAEALAEDLRRFLEGRPIQARPVGRIERAAKWARRRPAAAALLTLTALLLLAAVGGLLWGQQRRLEQVRQQAEREQRTKYLNREATAALDEGARSLRKLHERLRDPQQAHVLLSDIDQWQALVQAGQGALARGQALARSEPALLGEDLRQRLQELERQLQADGRDYQLARKLDDIRLEAWSLADGKWERAKALASYPGAFAEAGYDVEKGDVGQLTARIRQSRIRYALVAALDLWAVLSADPPRRRLLALTGQADPDRWRNQVRQALAGYDTERLRRLAVEVDLSVQPPQMVLALAVSLPRADRQVTALLRRALDQYPGDFWLHFNLGTKADSLVESTGCFRAAMALRPKSSMTHYNLGTALQAQKDYAGAIRHFRKALQLEPNYAPVHHNWGVALAALGDYAGAIRHYEQALRLKPDYPVAHYNRGIALARQGKLAEAEAAYREALRLKPDYPTARCNLGHALRRQGEFRKALVELRRGDELGSRDPKWRYPSARWVRDCERLIELDDKLPGFLEGTTKPAGADERVELARVCAIRGLYRAAVRFAEEAFDAKAELLATHRYSAACYAALAGCGLGKDKAPPDAQERARLRRQALDWLRADLGARAERVAKGTPKERTAAAKRLRDWQADSDLAAVRGPDALTMLPEDERAGWQRLWADVQTVLASAEGKGTGAK